MPPKTSPTTTLNPASATQHLIPPGGHPRTKTTAEISGILTSLAGRPIDFNKAKLLMTLTPTNPAHSNPAGLLHFFYGFQNPGEDTVNTTGKDVGFVKFTPPVKGRGYAIRCNFTGIPHAGLPSLVLQGPWGNIFDLNLDSSIPDAAFVVAYWVANEDQLYCGITAVGVVFFHSVQIYQI